ncbi:MAG: protein-glutamate O-methyltransferase CheR [Oligoflexia bacterium]|nr:protein-glutamate O-methyltransferase CheR [Oligoflexia bacterium]MBF0366759.1 protein-glutamate O-methyltransferase CheR [Oligoflexia bacterium]
MSSEAVDLHFQFELSDRDFNYLKDLIYRVAGLKLNETKKTLMQSRIYRRLIQLELDGYRQYIQYLEQNPTEMEFYINALTTNKTDFYREKQHFDYLRHEYIPKLNTLLSKQHNSKTLMIWSAACSTGEEVYTLAMEFNDIISAYPKIDFRILGTDINTKVLDLAKTGVYARELIEHTVPLNIAAKSLLRGTGRCSGHYKIREELKSKIKFRQYNLMGEERFPTQFDIIFVRNVLIYFDREGITKVIGNLLSHLRQDGLLFIGHSENLHGVDDQLKMIRSAVFRKF